jgi:hypothetical protein
MRAASVQQNRSRPGNLVSHDPGSGPGQAFFGEVAAAPDQVRGLHRITLKCGNRRSRCKSSGRAAEANFVSPDVYRMPALWNKHNRDVLQATFQ